MEPANVIQLPVARHKEQARAHASQALPSRREPLSWIDREATEAIVFFVMLFVIDALAVWGVLWLENQPFMGAPLG
jgi:hypothetical protein